jgi:hypothetical protein
MLNTTQIKSLKQVNISVDGEKTKQRVQQVWKASKNTVKNDVVALAGCSKATVYRVFDTGSISIKLAIAIGQTLNINPYFLTGELDEQGTYSEILLLQILDQHGYKKLLDELAPPADEVVKPKRKYTRKQKVVEEAAPEPEPEVVPEPETEVVEASESEPEQALKTVDEPAPQKSANIDFAEEELQALIHAQMILKNAGVENAKNKLDRIIEILIS